MNELRVALEVPRWTWRFYVRNLGLLPESARQTYLAVLLFAKNPTVIALTMIWWIGLIRQSFRVPDPQEVSLSGADTRNR